MSAEVVRELSIVRRSILRRLGTDDALGLRSARRVEGRIGVDRLTHLSDADKLDQTRDWVASLLKESTDRLSKDTQHYIDQAYEKGVMRAFDDVRKPLKLAAKDDDVKTALGSDKTEYVRGTRDEFIRQVKARQSTQSRKDVLRARVRNEFESMANGVQSSATRTVTDALSQGKSSKELREVLTDVFEKATIRGRRIASNEIVRVFAESQLDGFEILGVERVGVSVEWGTADDEKVCPACKSLGTVVLTIREARGMIPRHVGCRCAWKPYGVSETEGKKKRTQKSIQASIKRSKKTGIGSSVWAKGKRIAKKRPPKQSKVEELQVSNRLCCGLDELYRFVTEGDTDNV